MIVSFSTRRLERWEGSGREVAPRRPMTSTFHTYRDATGVLSILGCDQIQWPLVYGNLCWYLAPLCDPWLWTSMALDLAMDFSQCLQFSDLCLG